MAMDAHVSSLLALLKLGGLHKNQGKFQPSSEPESHEKPSYVAALRQCLQGCNLVEEVEISFDTMPALTVSKLTSCSSSKS